MNIALGRQVYAKFPGQDDLAEVSSLLLFLTLVSVNSFMSQQYHIGDLTYVPEVISSPAVRVSFRISLSSTELINKRNMNVDGRAVFLIIGLLGLIQCALGQKTLQTYPLTIVTCQRLPDFRHFDSTIRPY